MDAHVVVTDSLNGTTTSLLLRQGYQIDKTPITGLNQVVTVGDTAERSDQRTPQVIYTDQRGGMGAFAYTETEGITAFTDSTCDTRFPGLVVLPPAVTQLGTTTGNSANYGAVPVYVEYLGETNAKILAWMPNTSATTNVSIYNPAAGTWSSLTTVGADNILWVSAFVRYAGKYWLAMWPASGIGLIYSTTGAVAAWTKSGFTLDIAGACVHDGKFWAFVPSTSSGTLRWTDDPTIGTGWETSATLQLQKGENGLQLVEWRNQQNRSMVVLVTTQRLILYDEDADAFITLDDWSEDIAATTVPRAFVNRSTGFLYVVFDNPSDETYTDALLEYSGVRRPISPNQLQGLPEASRTTLVRAQGGKTWLYAWGRPRSGTTDLGRTMALGEQGGFHTLLTGTTGTTAYILGGGYARGLLWTVQKDGKVFEQSVPDTSASPLFATRSYRTTTTFYHEYAFTDGGTPDMWKLWRWVRIKCLDHTSANKVPGLATSTSVTVEIRSDEDTAWTLLGTLTSSDTFPATLPINSGDGVSARQMKVRLGLSTSNSARTPVVAAVALAYDRREIPRYAYTVVADLRPLDSHPLYSGLDLAQIAARIDQWTQPEASVRLDIAGGDWAVDPANAVTVLNCSVEYRAQLDPDKGLQQATLVFSDKTPPASG